MAIVNCDQHGWSGIMLVEKRMQHIVLYTDEKIPASSIRDVGFYDEDDFCWGGGKVYATTVLEQNLPPDEEEGYRIEYDASEIVPICINCFQERLI